MHAPFRVGSERRIYAAAKNFVVRAFRSFTVSAVLSTLWIRAACARIEWVVTFSSGFGG